MVSRPVRYLILVLVSLLLLLAAGGAWLLGTEAGARFALAAVSRLSPAEIRVEELAGNLTADLHLQGVEASWPGGTVALEELRLRWRPRQLLRRHLQVDELSLRGVRLQLQERAEPPPAEPSPFDPGFPTAERLPAWSGQVAVLKLTDLRIERPDQEPFQLQEFSAGLRWNRPLVEIDNLRLVLPQLRLTGDGRGDLAAPNLELRLQAALTEPAAQVDEMSLELSLQPTAEERRMTGPLRWQLAGAGTLLVDGSATVDWRADRLILSPLHLRRPEEGGEVGGRLELAAGPEPVFDLALRAERLDLRPFLDLPTDLTLEVEAAGTTAAYRGQLRLVSRGDDWRDFRLAAPFNGSSGHLELPGLEGAWLGGQLQGEVAADWRQASVLRLRLQGEGLDPARITPEWPGQINFLLSASALRPAESPLRVEVDGRLLDSRLRGQPLTGVVRGTLEGEELSIAELLLRGEGVELTARGRLQERIDFHARVDRLGSLVPQARGRLQAEGWGRWRQGHLSGRLQAAGGELALGELRLRRFRLEADHAGKDRPFRVSAELQEMVHGELRLTRVGLQAEGLLENHRLRLAAAGPELELDLAARGGYAEEAWSGTLTALAGRERRLGRWQLERPTDLRLAAEGVRVAPFYLAGDRGARLQGAADLKREPLRGEAQAHWERFDLSLANPWLTGVQLEGESSGSLAVAVPDQERLDFSAEVQARGRVIAEGQAVGIERLTLQGRWDGDGLAGRLDLALDAGGRLRALLTSEEPGRPALPTSGEAQLQWDDLDLALLSPWLPEVTVAGDSRGDLRGGWAEGGGQLTLSGRLEWAGELRHRQSAWTIRRAAVDLDWRADQLRAEWELQPQQGGGVRGSLTATSPPGLEMPAAGRLSAGWDDFDLTLLNPLLPEGEVTGTSSGRLEGGWGDGGERLDLAGHLELSGRVQQGELDLALHQARAELTWGEQGLDARWGLALAAGGSLDGRLRSAEPARLALPEQGRLEARWQGIDLALLRPWMPEQMLLEGRLGGEVGGGWHDGRQLDLTAEAALVGGELQWEGEGGLITAPLKQAEMRGRWRQESLEGELSLVLADYGRARGRFSVPLPARLPVAMRPDGPLRAELNGTLQEEGLLTALLPGLVQETRGRLSLDLRVGGTWEAPDLGGQARLTEAGAYLPVAGVRLQEVEVQARLAGEEVRVESFRVRSGPGHLEGSALLRLENWRPHSYRATLRGERFQVVDLPELQMLTSPALEVEGDQLKVAVRGDIVLPQVLVRGREQEAMIAPSPDVIIVDDPEGEVAGRDLPMALDLRVRIVLGDHVLVKAEGLDARLEGSLRLNASSLITEEITAQGEIRVAQGHFATYGVRLRIERGTILFAGGPVDRPTLDILALRTIGEIKAGVRVTGTPRNPELVLYSEPSMPDSDVLAYMILGHPVGQGEGNVSLLMTAAGALLTQGESAVLQDRLKRLLGVDVLEVEAGDGDVEGSQITIGKYLSPDLYISFGQALFANTNVVRLRYDLSRKWQLESTVGDESGVDLYYRIEFR